RTRHEAVLLRVLCFLYGGWGRLVGRLGLSQREGRAKDIEMVVFRHELQVLRRQVGRPRIGAADRALLAALSLALPRDRRRSVLVQPATPLRWHPPLVPRRWTYGGRSPGWPALAVGASGRRTRAGRTSASTASWSEGGSDCRRAASGTFSAATASSPRRGVRASAGANSSGSRPAGSSSVTSLPSKRSGCGACTSCSS